MCFIVYVSGVDAVDRPLVGGFRLAVVFVELDVRQFQLRLEALVVASQLRDTAIFLAQFTLEVR